MINGITASKGVIWEICFFTDVILFSDYVEEAIKEPHNVQNMICGEICGFFINVSLFLSLQKLCKFCLFNLGYFLGDPDEDRGGLSPDFNPRLF